MLLRIEPHLAPPVLEPVHVHLPNTSVVPHTLILSGNLTVFKADTITIHGLGFLGHVGTHVPCGTCVWNVFGSQLGAQGPVW
jgi:hypothetical protein